MGDLLGKCLGLISGPVYQRLRAANSPAFTHRSSSDYLDRISRVTAGQIRKLSTGGKLSHGLLNPVACLAKIPFWTMADILYGDRLPPGLQSELDSLTFLRESLWARMIQGGTTRFTWSQHLPTKTVRDLRDFKRRWAAFNDQAHDIARQEQSQACILPWCDDAKSGQIEKEQLLQTIDEMLFANLDVTMGGISWSLLYLAANEDVQGQIRQEIAQARSTTEATGPGWTDYIRSPSTMLAASILESSRLAPLAAFSVPQAAPTERVVSGFLVPAGTNIIVDTHALNISNPYWGPDGDTYRPARFLEGRKPVEMRYHFWRFGFGPRQCLGKYVFDLMIRIVVAQLVEGYHLRLAETTRWDKNPRTWIMHPDTEIRCDKIEPAS